MAEKILPIDNSSLQIWGASLIAKKSRFSIVSKILQTRSYFEYIGRRLLGGVLTIIHLCFFLFSDRTGRPSRCLEFKGDIPRKAHVIVENHLEATKLESCSFNSLPSEMIFQITAFISTKDLLQFKCTNLQTLQIVNQLLETEYRKIDLIQIHMHRGDMVRAEPLIYSISPGITLKQLYNIMVKMAGSELRNETFLTLDYAALKTVRLSKSENFPLSFKHLILELRAFWPGAKSEVFIVYIHKLSSFISSLPLSQKQALIDKIQSFLKQDEKINLCLKNLFLRKFNL